MRLLFTGRGTSGSWQIRGVQLGQTMGATVQAQATSAAGFDAAIMVKRADDALLRVLRRDRVAIIWDIVDSWPQPVGNSWCHAQSMAWLSAELARITPQAVIAPTRAMASDVQRIAQGLPVLWLPHHHRPGLQRVEHRPVQVLGYEGGEQYIAQSRAEIERMCADRGMRFAVNPADLHAVDAMLAWRDSSGYPPQAWKSGVKSATAHALGVPIICRPESGYREMACGAEIWADTVADIGPALDDARQHADKYRRACIPYTVDHAAHKLREWLCSIAKF